ncbi:hypothetical protein SAMN04488092_12311 [Thalassovita taeanensis]|uniref:Uncharacterized protein n=2 Tax=Thalassovita taeanensis TaxID=657014 RepID=A0A1H9L4L8_9RHOB|nr:hypothetical protein SAMN04488092_12311 [Thalassovita taeanensis]
MNRLTTDDWNGASASEVVPEFAAVQKAALAFDWNTGDMRVLGRLMSKLGLDLATAVQVFLNGRPRELNYLRKDEVALEDSARSAMLDCLHKKICCGFYLPDPNVGLAPVRAEAGRWIAAQKDDRAKGRVGRWVFDERKFEAISDDGPRQIIMPQQGKRRPMLLRLLMEPPWA